MTLDISKLKDEYISASEAGNKIGYTSDYIGQLCRAGKIPSKLIDRTWFVDLKALILHKKNRNLLKGRKPRRILISKYDRDSRPFLPTLSKRKEPSLSRGLLVVFLVVFLALGVGMISSKNGGFIYVFSDISNFKYNSTALILSGFESLKIEALDLSSKY